MNEFAKKMFASKKGKGKIPAKDLDFLNSGDKKAAKGKSAKSSTKAVKAKSKVVEKLSIKDKMPKQSKPMTYFGQHSSPQNY